MNKLHNIFDQIHAEQEIKDKTVLKLTKVAQKKRVHRGFAAVRIAIVCAALFLFIWTRNVYYTTTAYIGLEINPSVEFSVNRFGRVIGAVAYNNDGEQILNGITTQHKDYETVIKYLLYALDGNGYLTDGELLSITVWANDSGVEVKMLNGTESIANAYIMQGGYTTVIDAFTVSDETKEQAHGHHMSAAKYVAITELMETDSTATFDNCQRRSISEIKQMMGQGNSNHRKHGNGHH